MSPPPDKCPKCGGVALAGGLCPQCLLLAGLETSVLPVSEGQMRGVSSESIIVGLFPELEDIRLLARGGMGVVYQAHQRGVDRDIALKLLPLEMIDAPDAEERFEIEARAAARLDHPNIITLYEFGKRGRSLFLKMKLVEGGRSLAHALRERSPWRAKETVALLIKLARAVHHAHQHGVIHRDIKPGNVLLDPEGEPLLSDFGLARIVEENTGLTRSEMVLGTANYMAPEQADGKNADLTTAADVYSLGAVLYEMLTGKPPFGGASLAEILHRVIQEDPASPSAINESVDQDLSTICLKCLDKNPGRRYGSAEALAEDLALWQEGRPISARRISTAGRITKWARRRPAIAVLTSALAASVVLGSTLAIWEAVRATHAEEIAKAEAAKAIHAEAIAKAEAAKAFRSEETAKAEAAKAIRAEKSARDEAAISKSVTEFINNDLFFSASPLREPDRDLKVRTVLDRASKRIGNRFQDQPLVEAAIRLTLGSTYRILGDHDQAQQHLIRSVELRKRILGEEHPETLVSRYELANLLSMKSQFAEAEAEMRELIRIRTKVLGPENVLTLICGNDLAGILRDEGRYTEAEDELRGRLKIEERVLGPKHPLTLGCRFVFAIVHLGQGKYVQVEAECRAILEIRKGLFADENLDTMKVRECLVLALLHQGKYAEVAKEQEALLKIQERVLGPENAAPLSSRIGIAFALDSQGKHAEAEAEVRAVLAIQERLLGTEAPATLSNRSGLASTLCHQGKNAEAEIEERMVLKAEERILGPEDLHTLKGRMILGCALMGQNKFAEAEAEYRAVLKIRERDLGPEHPETLYTFSDLALSLFRQGKIDEARDLSRQAFEGQRRVLGATHPDTRSTEKLFQILASCYPLMLRPQSVKSSGDLPEDLAKRYPNHVLMFITFQPVTHAAAKDGSNLQSGEGSWLDRGMNPASEPGKVRLLMPAGDANSLLNTLNTSEAPFIVQVINSEQGCLETVPLASPHLELVGEKMAKKK